MRRLSLRLRLALASSVGVFLIAALGGFLQYRLLSNSFITRVDEQLERVTNLAELFGPVGYANIDPFLTQITEGQPIVRQRVDRNGNVLDSVGGRGMPAPPEVLALAGRDGPDVNYTDTFGGLRFRIRAHPLGTGQVLLVGRPIEDVIEYQHRLFGYLVAQCLLMTVLAGMLGYLVARQAIRPVQRTADTAEKIATTGDLGRRIDAPTSDRDLKRLTRTVNTMLDRIEESYTRQGEMLEAERRFVADASHELRTPLTTIKGNVDYLRRTAADPDAVEDLRQAADRLEKLVAALTQLAREDAGVSGEPQLLDLGELTADVLAEPEFAALAVEASIGTGAWVRASEGSMTSVVRNLVANAAKYGAEPVRVSVEVEHGWVVLDVTDAGPGVATEDVQRVFERFWRSADAKGRTGSGLGLSIVASAVRGAGGEVTAFAGPGGHFRATLPAATPPRNPSSQAQLDVTPAAGHIMGATDDGWPGRAGPSESHSPSPGDLDAGTGGTQGRASEVT